jgi:cell division protein FtsQ
MTTREAPRNVRNERRDSMPAPRGEAVADSPEPPPARARGSMRGASQPSKKSEASTPTGGSASVRPPALRRLAGKLRQLASLGQLVLGLAFVLASSGAVAWGARRYLVTSPRFALRTLQVDGNVRLSPQEVAERGGLRLGDNVFALDLAEVERSLANEPWIANVRVQRKLPGSVIVAVTEHDPLALVSLQSELFLVSRAGRVFKQADPNDPLDLPVITGIDVRDVASDREGVEKEVQRALDVIDELGKSPLGQRFPVQEIHLERDGSLQAIVGRDAIALHLGRPPFRGKLEQAARVVDEVAARKAQPSIVFLDNEGSPERVVVRLR